MATTRNAGSGPHLYDRLREADRKQPEDPAPIRFLFGHTGIAWIWLLLRVWLGWQWLQAGWGKVANPKWVQTGEALQGFWQPGALFPARRPVPADTAEALAERPGNQRVVPVG